MLTRTRTGDSHNLTSSQRHRCGIVGVTDPNVILLDSDFECRQVDLSGRLGGKLTSLDVEKST